MKRPRLLILSVLVVALLVVGGLRVWQAKRQYTLDRQLIAALLKHDNKTALTLVNAGADPNTRQEATPAPTLPQLSRHLLHRSPPPASKSRTAFQLACGGVFRQLIAGGSPVYHSPDDVPLVQAMLVHSADVRATDKEGVTALSYALLWDHPHSVQLLLDYGANVNAPDNYGVTPLMLAAMVKDVDTTRLLLEHGASVTLTDMDGSMALHYAIYVHADSRMIRLLLAHGANPNARNKHGDTPLRLAQQVKRSDIVALLHKGAK